MKPSKYIRLSHKLSWVIHCATVFLFVAALPVISYAQQPSFAPGSIHRTIVHDSDPKHKAHIFLSVPAEKQFRAEHNLSAPIGAAVTSTNMVYGGGKVMRNPTNYLIFWQPPGRAAFPAGYQAAIEKFFQNVGGTPFYNIVTQYTDKSGVPVPNATSLGATSYTDSTTVPPSGCNGAIATSPPTPGICPLTDADIQNEVSVALAANSAWDRPGDNVMYYVFTPSDVDECFNATNCFAAGDPNGKFCAYHSSFGGNTIYAYQPFASIGACYPSPNLPGYPNGQANDVVIGITSHEMFEANTDPYGDGWKGTGGNDDEIGDKCAYNFAYNTPDGTNIVLNGNRYQLQTEWSNDSNNNTANGCTKRYGSAAIQSVPTTLAFGTVMTGTTATKDLLIQNLSGGSVGDLNILNIRSTGSSMYSLLNLPPTAATVKPGESLAVQVKFSPLGSFANPSANIVVDTDTTVTSSTATSVTGTVGVPPVALCKDILDAPTDLNLCTNANASINNGSNDPDGDPITLKQSPGGPYTLGFTNVTLSVTDTAVPTATSSCTGNITVKDHQPPNITCPTVQTVQCTSPSGAAVNLTPTFFDNCSAVTASCAPPSGSTFGLGSTPVNCTATDSSSNTASCSSSVIVTDVSPVISSVVASPNVLRPPNKKLDPVTIIVKDTATCDTSPSCKITSVTSNSGSLVSGTDYVITGDLTLQLRASGNGGHAMTYIVTTTCTSHFGGATSSAQTTVQAPL